MKKIFLLFLILISVNVQAENKYTDFEFKELVEEKQADDEFNKYESVTFNRFYTPVEVDIEYVEGLETIYFDYVDPTDFIIKEYTLQREPVGYPFEEHITVNCGDDYLTDQIILEEAYDFQNTVSEIEAYLGDTKVGTSIEIDESANIVNVYLDGDYYINELKFVFYYSTEETYSIIFTVVNTSGTDRRTSVTINLSPNTNKAIINSLNEQNYVTYVHGNGFSFQNTLHCYYFTITLYKHYNIEKDYYIDSEEEEIEGYIYDSEDSYVMYKHYTRKLIEETTIEDAIIEEPSEEEPITTEVITTSTSQTDETTEKTYTNISNKNYNSANDEVETDNYPAVVDTTKNGESLTNLESDETDTKDTTSTLSRNETKCKTKTLIVTVLLAICLILVLIDIIFNGIDLIKSVKKKR